MAIRLLCAECGYDFTGEDIGHYCPSCGHDIKTLKQYAWEISFSFGFIFFIILASVNMYIDKDLQYSWIIAAIYLIMALAWSKYFLYPKLKRLTKWPGDLK